MFLTVGDLKDIIKDIPDDYVVTVTSSETYNHILKVSSVGILHCKYEDPERCLSFCCDKHSISEETKYTETVLFS